MWLREGNERLGKREVPRLTKPAEMDIRGTSQIYVYKDEIARLQIGGGSFLWSSGFLSITPTSKSGSNIPITKQNLERVLCYFSVLRSVRGSFYTYLKEPLVPDESVPGFKDFINECIVYSIFDTKNYMFSSRKPLIINELFWIDKNTIIDRCNQLGLDPIYRDCLTSDERFISSLLTSVNLNGVAKALLQLGTDAVLETLPKRLDLETPNSLLCWDASWHQLSYFGILKDYEEEIHKLLEQLRGELEAKAYDFGIFK